MNLPELPEVETVRKTLADLAIGRTILHVSVYWPNIIKYPTVEQFQRSLQNERIEQVGRRGKFLIIYTNRWALVSHLRMEGKYRLLPSDSPLEKHMHVVFHFTDGTELRYHDVRKFGTMHLYRKGDEWKNPPLNRLGVEPLSDDFTFQQIRSICLSTSRKIKVVLLDQQKIAGLGNIYVDEVLYRSSIHPERAANTLSKEEIITLHQAIQQTLQEAVKLGGTTIRTYKNTQGKIGTFQTRLLAYGRVGEQCQKCGRPIEKIKVGGRGTHICTFCQR
jgi:formamidopyrimidine-DNA glycosylase